MGTSGTTTTMKLDGAKKAQDKELLRVRLRKLLSDPELSPAVIRERLGISSKMSRGALLKMAGLENLP